MTEERNEAAAWAAVEYCINQLCDKYWSAQAAGIKRDGDYLRVFREALERTVKDYAALRAEALQEALQPFAEQAPLPSQGLGAVGDLAEVELHVKACGQAIRLGFLKLGDFRRAAALQGKNDRRVNG